MRTVRPHAVSSLARTLDPGLPTNRAVLILLPLSAGAAAALAHGTGSEPGLALLLIAAGGGAATLGGWALGRELAPDDQRAAFVSLALTFAAFLTVPEQSVLLLFSALLLSRLVNRTVGLPPRVTDSLVVSALVGLTLVTTGDASVGVLAAAAFATDAVLPGGQRRQWLFSGFLLLMTGVVTPPLSWIATATRATNRAGPWVLAAGGLVSLLYLIAVAGARNLKSRTDATGEPLSGRRVRAAMLLVLMLALLSFGRTGTGPGGPVLIWATLTAVGISSLFCSAPGAR